MYLAALSAFYTRFNREAFSGLKRLIEDLILDTSGKYHAEDGTTWPVQARINIQQADTPQAMNLLIDDARKLIQEVQYDVEAQLTLRLKEYGQYKEILDRLLQNDPLERPFLSRLEGFLKTLRETHGLGNGYVQTLETRLKTQLEYHTERSLLDSMGKEILETLNALAAQATPKPSDLGWQQEGLLTADKKVSPRRKNNVSSVKKYVSLPTELENDLRAFDQFFHYYHEQREKLNLRYAAALEVARSFETWRDRVATLLLPNAELERLQREFAAQTAYILLVRMILVRIVEDKGLIPRIFTNGGLALWFNQVEPRYLKYAQGRSSEFLLDMAYASAQHIYAHFYSGIRLFDWYTPDRNLVVRILYRLAGYNLATINHDIIGHLYGRYVEDEHKHESGMYYTPPEVVEYILDRLGFSGVSLIEGKKLLDPACGSGTFLVSAARRVVQAYKDFYNNQIPPDKVQELVDTFKNSIYGLDLNPFACYLAETNLLIQVLDLLKIAYEAGQDVHIDRFHIYNTDTLRYAQKTREILAKSAAGGLSGFGGAEELPTEEQIKAKLGELKDGFDFVVANPPYVRADEGNEGLLAYRADLKENHPIESVRSVLQLRWDMFVPFVALGYYLLTDSGRLGMITSSAIESIPYASNLRLQIVESQIDEVSFFPGVQLFHDAVVENTIFLLTKKAPSKDHKVQRYWHSGKPPALIRKEELVQDKYKVDVFKQDSFKLEGNHLIRLDDIAYVAYGMRLNSASREKRFFKDELISSSKDERHPVPYVEARDLDAFDLLQLRFLEYGSGLRAPSEIYRPTFPQMYDRPKILLPKVIAKTDSQQTQGWLDTGALGEGWLYTNDSVSIVIRWFDLMKVENRSIGYIKDRPKKEEHSKLFSHEYILGVINSKITSTWIRSNRRDGTNLYPDDFKALPIPQATAGQQAPIVERVQQLQALGLEFFRLRRLGWKVGNSVQGVAHLPAGVARLKLGRAKMLWPLRPLELDAKLNGVWAGQGGLYRGGGRNTRKVIESDAPAEALEWLARQFATLDPETTWRMAEASGLEIPSNPTEAKKALEALQAMEKEILSKRKKFDDLRKEVDDLVAKLYESK